MSNSIKCKFGLHDWSQWEIVREGKLLTINNTYDGDYILQQRHCKRCGLTKRKQYNSR